MESADPTCCRHDTDPKVDQSLAELNKHVRNLHEVEKAAVRRVLVEERSRYCTFIACLKPVLGEEISLVSELQQLEEVVKGPRLYLVKYPHPLPGISTDVIAGMKKEKKILRRRKFRDKI
jgi:hypothetical protein